MHLPITILYGTLLILVTQLLAVSTSLYRLRARVFVVTPDQLPKSLLRLVRAHGNSAEWLPVTIFLIAFLEMQGANPARLTACAVVMLIARIAHSLNLVWLKGLLRPWPAVVMYSVTFFMAFWSLHLRIH
jgi:uncharacterized membrane protein YecN with MAPEG domain